MKLLYSWITIIAFSYCCNSVAAYMILPVNQHAWVQSTIPVCWERPLSILMSEMVIYKTYQGKVEKRLVSEFKRAGINLLGWKTCGEKSKGIRVRVVTKHDDSVSRKIGRKLDGLKNGIVLSFMHDNPEFYPRFTALHEFLHGFGFLHEHDRKDVIDCKDDPSEMIWGLPNGQSIGHYDPNSMMNYCLVDKFDPPTTIEQGEKIDEKIAKLSDADVAALKGYMTKPVAEIESLPRRISKNSFPIKISGANLARVFVQHGESSKINCKNRGEYVELTGSENVVQINVSVSEPKEMKICALGEDKLGNEQPLETYSSVVWQQDPLGYPILYSHHLGVTEYSTIDFIVDSYTKRFGKYKVGEISETKCNKTTNYEPIPQEGRVTLSDWVSNTTWEKQYQVCLKGEEEKYYSISLKLFPYLRPEVRGIPIALEYEKINIFVENNMEHIVGFKNKMVKLESECFKAEGYSSFQSVDKSIELEKLEILKGKNIGCFVSLDKHGVWLPFGEAEVYNFPYKFRVRK